MKIRLTESLAAKITAVILSYVCVLVLAVSCLATVIMGYYKFYFSSVDTVKTEIMTDMAQDEAYHVENMLHWGKGSLESYYSDKNVWYEIIDAKSGEITDTNYEGAPYIATAESEYYEYDDYLAGYNEYGEEIWSTTEIHVSTVKVYVAENMTKSDLFSVMLKIVELGYNLKFAVIIIMLISLILAITLLCYLYCAAGHKQGGVIRLNYLDKIPFDIYTAFIVGAAILSIAMIDSVNDLAMAFVIVFLVGTVDYFLALGYTLSFATRVKTRTLIKNTLIYRVLAFAYKIIKKFINWVNYSVSNLKLTYKTGIVIAVLMILELIVIVLFANSYWDIMGFWVFFLICANIGFILISLYLAAVMQKIKQGGEKIAGGQLEHKIDTKYMIGDFKSFSESLNNINDGLQSAVNERMRSEHFKTELITNVSHDIKTPLTSIVNYVDLIKKEECDNETVNSYIEVLDRQSSRLKKLVEDLVEASKASTGNLSVNLMPCDVGVLLTQTVGEFEDRLEKSGVTPIVNIPESPIRIMADGRHLWRAFDNLMNNVCKYAMAGTRVYLDVKAVGDKAVITFRNISKYELNVSPDELMERFVRGDSSRNTEGSGLGLSIAKSLVELQNGNMALDVDGDLFKVTLEFPIIS